MPLLLDFGKAFQKLTDGQENLREKLGQEACKVQAPVQSERTRQREHETTRARENEEHKNQSEHCRCCCVVSVRRSEVWLCGSVPNCSCRLGETDTDAGPTEGSGSQPEEGGGAGGSCARLVACLLDSCWRVRHFPWDSHGQAWPDRSTCCVVSRRVAEIAATFWFAEVL